MTFESLSSQEKQQKWQAALERLDHIADNLGMPIDENIKETIAALNVNEIPTDGSCGGHLEDDRLRFPYIQGEAVGTPQYRYKGEKEIVEELVRKYNLKDFHEIFDSGEIEQDYYNATDDHEETDEYKEWFVKNTPLREQVAELIKEFYTNTSNGGKLHLQPIYPGYRVEAHIREDIEDMEEIKIKIQEAQEEFRKFTEFLKNKFFQSK